MNHKSVLKSVYKLNTDFLIKMLRKFGMSEVKVLRKSNVYANSGQNKQSILQKILLFKKDAGLKACQGLTPY